MSATKVKDTYLSKYKAQLKSVKLTDDSKELQGEQLDKAIERVQELDLGGRMTLLRQIDSGSLYQHFVDSIEDAYMKNIVCADDMIYLKSKHKIVFSPDLTKFNNVNQDDKESVSTFISDIDGLNNEIDDAKEGETKNIFATKVYDTETREVRKSFFNNDASIARDKGFPAESIEDAESMNALVRQHLGKGVGDSDSAVDALERLRVVFYMYRFPHLADDLYDYFDHDVELMQEVCKKSVFYKNMSDCLLGKEAIEEHRKGALTEKASDCKKSGSLLKLLCEDIRRNSFIDQPDADYWTASHILQTIAGYHLYDKNQSKEIFPTPYTMLVGQTSTGKDSRLAYARNIITKFTSHSYVRTAPPASPQALYDDCYETGNDSGKYGTGYCLDESGAMFSKGDLNRAVSSSFTSAFGGKTMSRPRKASTGKKDEIVKFPIIDRTCISLMTATQPDVMLDNIAENSEALTSGFLARFTCAYLEPTAGVLKDISWCGLTKIDSTVSVSIDRWIKDIKVRGITTDFECGDVGEKIREYMENNPYINASGVERNLSGKCSQKRLWQAVAVAAPSTKITDYDVSLSTQAIKYSITSVVSLVSVIGKSKFKIDADRVIEIINGMLTTSPRVSTIYRKMELEFDPPAGMEWKKYRLSILRFIRNHVDEYGWDSGKGSDKNNLTAVGKNRDDIIKRISDSKKDTVRVKR